MNVLDRALPPLRLTSLAVRCLFLIGFLFMVSFGKATHAYSYCDQLPPPDLFGPIVRVVSREWTSFSHNASLNATLSFILQSSDQACKVETKFVELSSENGHIAFFPLGRQNLQRYFVGLESRHGCQHFDENFVLGKSVTSDGPELGMSLLRAQTRLTIANVHFALLHRQICSNLVLVTKGLLLPQALPGGSPLYFFSHREGGQLRANAYATGEVSLVWSALPPRDCSLEITFMTALYPLSRIELSDGTDIDGYSYVEAVVGLTYLTSTNAEAAVTLFPRRRFLTTPEREFVFSYRARCDIGVTRTIKIVNADINFLAPVSPAGNTAQLFLAETLFRRYYIIGVPRHGASDVIIRAWSKQGQYTVGLPRRMKLELTQAYPFHVIDGFRLSDDFRGANISLRYHQTQRIVRTRVRGSGKLFAKSGTLASKRYELESSNPKCLVHIQYVVKPTPEDPEFQVAVHPFGFFQGYTHLHASPAESNRIIRDEFANRFESYGPRIGVELIVDLVSAPFKVEIAYDTLCPTTLKFATNKGAWRNQILQAHRAFRIPSGAASSPMGQSCWTEIVPLELTGQQSTDDYSYYYIYDSKMDPGLRVSCESDRTTALVHRYSMYQSNCSSSILVQGLLYTSEFAFRRRCGSRYNTSSPSLMFVPSHGVILPVRRQASEFNDKTGLAGRRNLDLYRTWSLVAESTACFVRIDFQTIDTSHVLIYEGFTGLVGGHNQDAFAYPRRNHLHTSYFRNVTYFACSNRVFVETHWLNRWNDQARRPKNAFTGSYRAICNREDIEKRTRACGSFEVNLDVVWEWHTMKFDSVNFNQVRLTEFRLNAAENLQPLLSNTMFIEVQFLSLIQQSYFGGPDDYLWSEILGVYVEGNRRYRASVGGSHIFRASETVRITSDVLVDPFEHVFTVRYRMYDNASTSSHTPRDLPDLVLVASDEPKTVDFDIPSQFSAEAKMQALVDSGRSTDEHTGRFHSWAFKFRWVIQPQNGSERCRVVVNFNRMDIGSGYLAETYHNNQHRLAVMNDMSNGFRHSTSFDCDPREPGSGKREGISAICVRQNISYASSSQSGEIGILFQSVNTHNEYEDPYPDEQQIFGDPYSPSGMETTWGSGWSATYKQVCDVEQVQEVFSTSVVTISTNANGSWDVGLPNLPLGKPLLFLNLTWHIVPRSPSCRVEALVVNGDSAFFILDHLGKRLRGGDVGFYFENFRAVLPNMTFVLWGVSTRSRTLMVSYRQVCNATLSPP